MYEDSEINIDLLDVCAHILHCWKKIFIYMIIFMLIVGGLMSYKDYIEIQNKYTDKTYAEMTRNMSESQLDRIEQFYSRYKTYRERINDNQFYMDHSLKMRLDSNTVSEYTTEYLVKTGYQNIMGSFATSALDMDDYSKMAAIVGKEADPRYMSELVLISGSLVQDSYDIDTDKVGDVINGNISNTYTGILSVYVKANDRNTCEGLATVADEAIKQYLEKISNAGIEVEISEFNTTYKEIVDRELAEFQRSNIDNGATLISDFYKFEEDAKKTLDEDEYNVFSYLIQKEQKVTARVHWKKWMVIGAVAGLFVSILIILVRYLCISGVKTVNEVAALTGKKELGVIVNDANSKIIIGKAFHELAQKIEFHGINKLQDSVAEEIIFDRVIRICKLQGTERVFVAFDSEDSYSSHVVNDCVLALRKEGLEADCGDPSSDVEALRQLRSSDAVVLAITVKSSKPDSIRKYIMICAENDIPMMGDFVVCP